MVGSFLYELLLIAQALNLFAMKQLVHTPCVEEGTTAGSVYELTVRRCDADAAPFVNFVDSSALSTSISNTNRA
jgi:hypothetical protein